MERPQQEHSLRHRLPNLVDGELREHRLNLRQLLIRTDFRRMLEEKVEQLIVDGLEIPGG